jgi:flagellar basal-body rod protein FlgC
MAVSEIMTISEQGMLYQKMRIDAATLNIANANVIQPKDGSGFKPLIVSPPKVFTVDSDINKNSQASLENQNIPDKLVFKPDHVLADNNGYVHYANIDMAEQMVTLTMATRAYEANIKAFNAQMNITQKAFEIGK